MVWKNAKTISIEMHRRERKTIHILIYTFISMFSTTPTNQIIFTLDADKSQEQSSN